MSLIGILGGTFDPIHYGHIRLAQSALQQLDLDQVRFIPLNIPPHRDLPIASAEQRLAMLELVTSNESNFYIDQRELESDDVSYTINTLKSLREEFSNDTFCLILGKDAFNKIDSWKDWQQLLGHAHIIVANRPGESSHDNSAAIKEWIEQNQTDSIDELKQKQNGCIYFMEIPMLDISSSVIRERLSQQKTINDLLPTNIINYIEDQNLYRNTA